MLAYVRSSVSNPDFQHLVEALDKELWQRYPDIEHQYAPFNSVGDEARVLVVYEEIGPVGCGCFRPMKEPATVEIKRMYVVPSFRNRGIGKEILVHLESWAKEQGFTTAKLETARRQPEAISAYQQSGYKEIPNYGPYANLPESICMEKSIM